MASVPLGQLSVYQPLSKDALTALLVTNAATKMRSAQSAAFAAYLGVFCPVFRPLCPLSDGSRFLPPEYSLGRTGVEISIKVFHEHSQKAHGDSSQILRGQAQRVMRKSIYVKLTRKLASVVPDRVPTVQFSPLRLNDFKVSPCALPLYHPVWIDDFGRRRIVQLFHLVRRELHVCASEVLVELL